MAENAQYLHPIQPLPSKPIINDRFLATSSPFSARNKNFASDTTGNVPHIPPKSA